MIETQTPFVTDQSDYISDLKTQMMALTLFPEQVFEYGTEDDITSKVAAIKAELYEHGVDADQVFRRSVSKYYELRVPLGNVIELDVTKKAS